ncbi:MAG: hypothetical protein ABJB55_01860 [Actinomycetota bacterium]
MRSTSLRVLAACAALALVAGLAVGSAGAAASCTASIAAGTGAPGDLLLATAGAPQHAFAAGIHYDGGDGHPLVQRFAGTSWGQFPIPTHAGAGTIQFQDAAVAGDRVWAVGALRNDKPMAGWLTGDVWHWSQAVDPGGVEDEFLGVTATPDGTLWAVGKHRTGADYQPLIERFDGTRWAIVTSPQISGSAVLRDVAATPDGSVWAAGWTVDDGGVTRPLIERWNGAAWTSVAAAGEGLLSGIAVLPGGNAMAVGWTPSPQGDRILTMQLGHGSWKVSPGSALLGRLTSVAAGEAVVAVGTMFDATGVPRALLVRWDNGWTPVDIAGDPAPDPGGDQLLAITGELGSFLAVGIRDTTEGFGSLVVTGTCRG